MTAVLEGFKFKPSCLGSNVTHLGSSVLTPYGLVL